jgi:hypothetical protein
MPVAQDSSMTLSAKVAAMLAAPFDASEVKFKPQVVKGPRALAIPYVDARAIQDRLDEVLGVDGWRDEYTPLPDGAVVCKLELRIGGEWIAKMDVGAPSEKQDAGDRLKAAFSDALKRAAVKFGIGRYLHRIPAIWAEYDSSKKQFTRAPEIPGARPASSITLQQSTAAPSSVPASSLPANGIELLKRLRAYDEKLAKDGLCAKGALLERVTQAGVKAGHGPDLNKWPTPAIALAVKETRSFEAAVSKERPDRKVFSDK